MKQLFIQLMHIFQVPASQLHREMYTHTFHTRKRALRAHCLLRRPFAHYRGENQMPASRSLGFLLTYIVPQAQPGKRSKAAFAGQAVDYRYNAPRQWWQVSFCRLAFCVSRIIVPYQQEIKRLQSGVFKIIYLS